MQRIEEIRKEYLKDIDELGSKSRFGFFSIPPNPTAGINMYENKTVVKDQTGKVKTESRNIYAGPAASGTLKKSYFQYINSVFVGDPYLEPRKVESTQKFEESAKLQGKEVYKPLSLSKTPLPKSAYEHIADKPVQKQVKDFTDENGKVITQFRNMAINPPSLIERQRKRTFKYISDPYQNYRVIKRKQLFQGIKLRGEVPFKSSSPVKELFSSPKQAYGEQGCKFPCKPDSPKSYKISNSNEDSAFRPSCNKKYDTFSYPEYMPAGQKQIKRSHIGSSTERTEQFRLVKQPNLYKPSPSIATMKSNILRTLR